MACCKLSLLRRSACANKPLCTRVPPSGAGGCPLSRAVPGVPLARGMLGWHPLMQLCPVTLHLPKVEATPQEEGVLESKEGSLVRLESAADLIVAPNIPSEQCRVWIETVLGEKFVLVPLLVCMPSPPPSFLPCKCGE